MHQCSYGRGALSCGHAQKNVWSEIGWGYLYQTRTIRRELGYAQDVRYFAIEHMDVRREAFQVCTAHQIPNLKDQCLGPGQPLHRFPASPSPSRRDTGTFPLRHALNPSMGRLYGNGSLFSG